MLRSLGDTTQTDVDKFRAQHFDMLQPFILSELSLKLEGQIATELAAQAKARELELEQQNADLLQAGERSQGLAILLALAVV
jgi:hypothetical protein